MGEQAVATIGSTPPPTLHTRLSETPLRRARKSAERRGHSKPMGVRRLIRRDTDAAPAEHRR
jgi:hypothetical protein